MIIKSYKSLYGKDPERGQKHIFDLLSSPPNNGNTIKTLTILITKIMLNVAI